LFFKLSINGQPLAAGDRVPLGPSDVVDATALAHASPVADGLVRPATLRMIPGEQSADYGEAIWSMTHRTSSRSDRMGVRLEGEPLGGGLEGAGSMRSVAVLPGTVQVPPDGQPIVLLADAQTIGGYPVIGHVIAADLPVAAQLRPDLRVFGATMRAPVGIGLHGEARRRGADVAGVGDAGEGLEVARGHRQRRRHARGGADVARGAGHRRRRAGGAVGARGADGCGGGDSGGERRAARA
jgi:hypothetical protein